ncbi:calvin cycle protein CP12-1, chloroplastic-like [Curcuma longa]|uniref:calvin cycle protein CP12-1, chloroplastic-like n=1 Tax=Curcuma longa TaxID=136217 RepID=UPI003D9ED49A
MATTAAAAGVSLSAPTIRAVSVVVKVAPRSVRIGLQASHRRAAGRGLRVVASAPSTPPEISKKVEESIKKAEDACAGDSVAGECAAAWDEVEELSAAASHARDTLKANSDPLENYCKDNPETDECRTYDT